MCKVADGVLEVILRLVIWWKYNDECTTKPCITWSDLHVSKPSWFWMDHMNKLNTSKCVLLEYINVSKRKQQVKNAGIKPSTSEGTLTN